MLLNKKLFSVIKAAFLPARILRTGAIEIE
jgi:hypothetical protein